MEAKAVSPKMIKKALLIGTTLAALAGCGPEHENRYTELHPFDIDIHKIEKIRPVDMKFQTIGVCQNVLPQPYEELIESNSKIRNSLVWADKDFPDGRTFAHDCDDLKDLAMHIKGEIELLEPPEITEQEEGRDFGYYSEEIAWNMYLAHVAHSLKLEVEKILPWSIADYDKEMLEILFDGRNFILYSKYRKLYEFGYRYPDYVGRAITDWSPKPAYEFFMNEGRLGETQLDAIYNLTQWVREHLVHWSSNVPSNWDGYIGLPPVEKILYPPEGARSWVAGCGGTTSFYTAMLAALNIPVKLGRSNFATSYEPDRALAHARAEFLSQGIGFMHSDDPYSTFARRGVNEIPVEELLVTFEQLEQLIDNPELDTSDGYTPTKGEQATFNINKYMMDAAFRSRADTLIVKRAHDILGHEENALENALSGPKNGGELIIWKPIYTDEEISDMRDAIDQTLTEIGNGSLEEGCWTVINRRDDYQVP